MKLFMYGAWWVILAISCFIFLITGIANGDISAIRITTPIILIAIPTIISLKEKS